jgi:hypothetical protein
LDTSLNKAQHKQELLCGKIFGSGRNVYAIEEPFYFSFNSDQSQNQGSARLNYEKIITARMHARGNDDVDNKPSDEMTRKMSNRTNRATTHT